MKRQLLLVSGCSMLLAGWLSAFLLNNVPQSTTIYIIGPTLLLGVGMAVIHKTAGVKITVVTLGLTALAALLTMNQLYPSQGVSISAFQKLQLTDGKSGNTVPLVVCDKDQSEIFVAPPPLESFADIEVRLFSKLSGSARMMVFDPTGNLYVSIPDLGAIYLLTDTDKDGFSEQPILFHVGMDQPHGLVWSQDRLYVAETSQILELKDTDKDNQADSVRIVIDGLPDDGGHLTRSLTFGKDGLLYLSIGSRCNACEEENPLRATILQVNPGTGKMSIFARGLRNTVGLAFSPDGETLWGSDIGRYFLGDDSPPDEINRIIENGHYGWPNCYGQQIPDPELGTPHLCSETRASEVDLPAHSGPFGIVFGDRLNAPEEFRNSLYVALHGSLSRTEPTGYKLIRIPYRNHKISGYGKEFLRGWLVGGKAWGRPVAPVVGPDGNLYLSDDRAQAIYKISWPSQK